VDQQPVSKEDWVDWRQHKVTQRFLRAMQQKREMLKEGLAENQSGSEREDCITMGRTQALKDVIIYAVREFEYDNQSEDDPTEDKPDGTESGSV
jgi:hypothetical protein